MIRVSKLVKRFGSKPVLRGVDLEISSGEFVALLGPNGAGKTTLLRILASLSRPLTGKVVVAGYRLPSQAAAVRRRLGVVFHQPLLYGDLTAEENLRFYGKMYAVPRIDSRIDDVLDLVGLAKRRHDLVRTFSRGMQQRLSIGRAIIHDPEVMLFDEPHTGLDQNACAMLNRVLETVADSGRTVLMTSHDLLMAEDLATRFVILSHGKIAKSVQRSELGSQGLPAFYRKVIEED